MFSTRHSPTQNMARDERDLLPRIVPVGVCPRTLVLETFRQLPIGEACDAASAAQPYVYERVAAWSGKSIEFERDRYKSIALQSGRVMTDRPMLISTEGISSSDFGNVRLGGCTSKYHYFLLPVMPRYGQQYLAFVPFIAIEPQVHAACCKMLLDGTLRQQHHTETVVRGITDAFSRLSHDVSAHHLHIGSKDLEIAFSHETSPTYYAKSSAIELLTSGGIEAYSIGLNREMLDATMSFDAANAHIEEAVEFLRSVDAIAPKLKIGHLSPAGVKLHLAALYFVALDETVNLDFAPELKRTWKIVMNSTMPYDTFVKTVRGEYCTDTIEQSIANSHHVLYKSARRELYSNMVTPTWHAQRARIA